jgi:hypothetical protein
MCIYFLFICIKIIYVILNMKIKLIIFISSFWCLCVVIFAGFNKHPLSPSHLKYLNTIHTHHITSASCHYFCYMSFLPSMNAKWHTPRPVALCHPICFHVFTLGLITQHIIHLSRCHCVHVYTFHVVPFHCTRQRLSFTYLAVNTASYTCAQNTHHTNWFHITLVCTRCTRIIQQTYHRTNTGNSSCFTALTNIMHPQNCPVTNSSMLPWH